MDKKRGKHPLSLRITDVRACGIGNFSEISLHLSIAKPPKIMRHIVDNVLGGRGEIRGYGSIEQEEITGFIRIAVKPVREVRIKNRVAVQVFVNLKT